MPDRSARTLPQRLRAAVRAFVVSDEPPEWFWNVPGVSRPASSGAHVDEQTALRVTAVLSAVKVLAESISTLPLQVFERREDGDRRAAIEHPLSPVLHTLASEETTAQALRETLCAHVLLRGTAYARVVRDGAGAVRELWPITGKVTAERTGPTTRDPLRYVLHSSGPDEVLRPDQVWRIAGLSWNGSTGLTPIGLAREAIGLAMAYEELSGSAVRNGARVPLVVTHPGVMTDEEYQRFKSSWNETFAGATNAGKTVIAEAGAKVEKVGMTFEDLQFLESRKFQIAEIARLFRVPLHMLYDDKSQPRANMEQSGLEFVVYSLRPWLVRFEQTITRDLLAPHERARYFAEHNVAGLLRGDFAARMSGYASGRQWGWLSVNDVRRLENMNAIADGDVYLQPSNMAPAGAPAAAGRP